MSHKQFFPFTRCGTPLWSKEAVRGWRDQGAPQLGAPWPSARRDNTRPHRHQDHHRAPVRGPGSRPRSRQHRRHSPQPNSKHRRAPSQDRRRSPRRPRPRRSPAPRHPQDRLDLRSRSRHRPTIIPWNPNRLHDADPRIDHPVKKLWIRIHPTAILIDIPIHQITSSLRQSWTDGRSGCHAVGDTDDSEAEGLSESIPTPAFQNAEKVGCKTTRNQPTTRWGSKPPTSFQMIIVGAWSRRSRALRPAPSGSSRMRCSMHWKSHIPRSTSPGSWFVWTPVLLRTSLCASRRLSSLTSSWQKEPRVSMPKILTNYLILSLPLTSRPNVPATRTQIRSTPSSTKPPVPKILSEQLIGPAAWGVDAQGIPKQFPSYGFFGVWAERWFNEPQSMVHECGCSRALQNWENALPAVWLGFFAAPRWADMEQLAMIRCSGDANWWRQRWNCDSGP